MVFLIGVSCFVTLRCLAALTFVLFRYYSLSLVDQRRAETVSKHRITYSDLS